MLVQAIFEVLQLINGRGVTLLLVEQNAAMALMLAARAYVMEQGRIVLEGTGQQLLGDTAVREAYLGVPASVTGDRL